MNFPAKDMMRKRKSVRSFDGVPLRAEDRAALETFVQTLENPFGVPVEFRLLNSKEHGLSSPVIAGETLYLTGKVPQTSASTPTDFEQVFDDIHQRWPEAKILHLAYSAVTTCSYQNALLASEDRDYVTSVDTKQVSVGQAAVVIETAHWLKEHPEA